MKFLTYNTGLLDLRILGRSMLKPADWVEQRFDRLAESIAGLDPDVVVLQEIYEGRHKKALAAKLSVSYPHAVISSRGGPGFLPASLLTLSKWPLRDLGFRRFRDMPLAERLFDNKGFLLASVQLPEAELLIANVHTTAGGTVHPEDPRTDRIRQRQIEQLLLATESSTPVIIAGDLNCGSVSTSNYRQLLDAGFADAWTVAGAAADGWTWEPTSVLNAGGRHTDWGCPAQRIDLVLLNEPARRCWQVLGAARAFTERSVPIRSDFSVTLSDHYAVLATLAPASGAPGANRSAHENP